MTLKEIEPLMIARPAVRLAGCDLNQAYLLSQMAWTAKECRSENVHWHEFEAEKFARQIGMTDEWVDATAKKLKAKCFNFFLYQEAESPSSFAHALLWLNVELLVETMKGGWYE
jgi:hypothetical protein